MAFSLVCPHCGAVLKSAAPVPVGKKVKCAKCGSAFEAPPLEDATAVTTAAASPRVATRQPNVEPAADEAAACDDEPRSKKRRDDDDPEDEPRSARKPKRTKKSSMGVLMLVGGLLGGGVLLVIGCGGCGGLGYWLYTIYGTSPIVGTWEQTNHPFGIRPTITFQDNGQGTVRVQNIQGSFKYKLNGNKLEMEPDQGVVGGFFNNNRMSRFNVLFNGNNELIATSLDLPGARPEIFRRIR